MRKECWICVWSDRKPCWFARNHNDSKYCDDFTVSSKLLNKYFLVVVLVTCVIIIGGRLI